MRLEIEENFYLRTFSSDDKESLFDLIDSNRKQLGVYLAWPPKTKTSEDTLWFINETIKEAKNHQYTFGIFVDEILVGVCSYNFMNIQNKKTEIGYWLGENFQGHGHMTKTVKALVDYGFNHLKLNRIAIHCATTNKASSAVAKRLGFKLEGIARQNEVVNGNIYDHEIYSLLSSEVNS